MFRMLKTPDLLLLLCLIGAASALYKQWIPDTNYENATNWDKGAVPCGSDTVQFPAQRKVSVFVETTHAVQEMRLPVDGEFILSSGAGFYVMSGQDPDCEAGITTNFRDSESLQWFDPGLWQGAATQDDLQQGNFLFSVHEESVPCQNDDVVFKARSCFRVDTSSSQASIPVKSVSVLGKTFVSSPEFVQYLSSSSGSLQFHGSSSVAVGNPSCEDPSGCECGNSVNHEQICRTVTCDSPNCKKPLSPVGHCCEICGAILTIKYSDEFNLQSYRQRIQDIFLSQSKYKSIQLGMSKVVKSQRLLGIVPFGTAPEIQVVILDDESGVLAAALAWDILKDAQSHDSSMGISEAEIQSSSGASSNQSGGDPSVVIGAVIGTLIFILLVVILVVLVRRGVIQMPAMPSMPSPLRRFKRNSDIGELGGDLDRGYDNPMFDKPHMMPDNPTLYGNETNSSIIMTQIGVHFVNPAYDDTQTDFNA